MRPKEEKALGAIPRQPILRRGRQNGNREERTLVTLNEHRSDIPFCRDRPKSAVSVLLLAGVDEAGRGPLAGPVTAACVVLPPDYKNPLVKDSKLLSATKREQLFAEITFHAVAYSIVSVGPRRIEKLNIREASRLAMRLAVERTRKKLRERSSEEESYLFHALIDGNTPIESNCSQETIIQGDRLVPVISAASILAKVTRDRLMEKLDLYYPGYGLATHKGYPTKSHREKIQEKGPSHIHRRSFAGVREYYLPTQKKPSSGT